MYYIVAYRESGEVTECPTAFPDLESATFCAQIALYHFGPEYTVIVEGDDEDGAKPQLRSADHLAAGDPAQNDPPS